MKPLVGILNQKPYAIHPNAMTGLCLADALKIIRIFDPENDFVKSFEQSDFKSLIEIL